MQQRERGCNPCCFSGRGRMLLMRERRKCNAYYGKSVNSLFLSAYRIILTVIKLIQLVWLLYPPAIRCFQTPIVDVVFRGCGFMCRCKCLQLQHMKGRLQVATLKAFEKLLIFQCAGTSILSFCISLGSSKSFQL